MWGSWGADRGCTGCAESTWGPSTAPPRRGVVGSLLARSLIAVDLCSLGVGQWTLQRLREKGPPLKTGVAGRKGGPMGHRPGPWVAQRFSSPAPCVATPLPAASVIPAPWRQCPGAPRGWAVPTRLLNLDGNQSKPVNGSTQPATSAPTAHPHHPFLGLPWQNKKKRQRRNSHGGLQVEGRLAP